MGSNVQHNIAIAKTTTTTTAEDSNTLEIMMPTMSTRSWRRMDSACLLVAVKPLLWHCYWCCLLNWWYRMCFSSTILARSVCVWVFITFSSTLNVIVVAIFFWRMLLLCSWEFSISTIQLVQQSTHKIHVLFSLMETHMHLSHDYMTKLPSKHKQRALKICWTLHDLIQVVSWIPLQNINVIFRSFLFPHHS